MEDVAWFRRREEVVIFVKKFINRLLEEDVSYVDRIVMTVKPLNTDENKINEFASFTLGTWQDIYSGLRQSVNKNLEIQAYRNSAIHQLSRNESLFNTVRSLYPGNF